MIRRRAWAGTVAVAVVFGTGGAAMAVSDGNYDPEKQHCSGAAYNYDQPDRVEDDCRTVNGSVWTGPNGGYSRDAEIGSAGIQQTADGEMPHEPRYNGPGAAAGDHAGEGVHLYFGADDNLNNGEHDSSPLVDNGPSDGGAIQVNVDPATLAVWVAALSSGDIGYVLAHPVPVVSAGAGASADGIAFSAQTERQVAFEGTGDGERHVADYGDRAWDPETCAGPSDGPDDCDDPATADSREDITYWEGKDGTTYVEPGVQVYEDPDAQASPAGPYPLPATYVGTCGVIVGAAGVDVETGCG